jgi:lariat debranching enzyme
MMEETTYVAFVGDVHGLTHTMVRTLEGLERALKIKLDLVLQVGDFEPHRHEADLRTMCSPSKYKTLGDFSDYHRGWRSFPWPVIFIGGNHEPHGWLEQHPEGFELIPSCEYLGRARIIERAGLKIAGLSGIYNAQVFEQQRPSYQHLDRVSNKAFIYLNAQDIDALLDQAERTGPVDVLLVHEWPEGMLADEDRERFAARTHRKGDPGNPMAKLLLELLSPRVVACGHMHARYTRQARARHATRPLELIGLSHMREREEAVAIMAWTPQGQLSWLA